MILNVGLNSCLDATFCFANQNIARQTKQPDAITFVIPIRPFPYTLTEKILPVVFFW